MDESKQAIVTWWSQVTFRKTRCIQLFTLPEDIKGQVNGDRTCQGFGYSRLMKYHWSRSKWPTQFNVLIAKWKTKRPKVFAALGKLLVNSYLHWPCL